MDESTQEPGDDSLFRDSPKLPSAEEILQRISDAEKRNAEQTAQFTVTYSDGTTATGVPPLPAMSPEQQTAPPAPELARAIVSNITEVERASMLPEISSDDTHSLPLVADGAIDRFMDDGLSGRRVMRIVADSAGVLHKLHCPGFGEETQP